MWPWRRKKSFSEKKLEELVDHIVDGNRFARGVVDMIVAGAAATDSAWGPPVPAAISVLYTLKSLEMRGHVLWMVYSGSAGSDIYRMFLIVRAYQLGVLSRDEVDRIFGGELINQPDMRVVRDAVLAKSPTFQASRGKNARTRGAGFQVDWKNRGGR